MLSKKTKKKQKQVLYKMREYVGCSSLSYLTVLIHKIAHLFRHWWIWTQAFSARASGLLATRGPQSSGKEHQLPTFNMFSIHLQSQTLFQC